MKDGLHGERGPRVARGGPLPHPHHPPVPRLSPGATHQHWGHEAAGLRLLQGHGEDVHGALGPCLLQQLLQGQEGAQLGRTLAAIYLKLEG